MAQFTINGVAFDRIHKGVALSPTTGEVLYTLTQLTEATIEVTSESREMRDKDGSLIKTIYTGKSGTFTVTNAFLDVDIIAQESGSDKEVATDAKPITMPYVHEFKRGETSATIAGLDADTVKVVGQAANGSMTKIYKKGTIASDDEFVASGEVIQFPTDTEPSKFVVIAERTVKVGSKVVNLADKFPKTVELILLCFTIDPCSPDVKRATYLRIPSFQTSPDHTITLAADSTIEFSGVMQTAYCEDNGDKIIYEMYYPEDDVYED